MDAIVPATWTGISETARSLRKLLPKPELALVAGCDDHGSWPKRGLPDATPSLSHGNEPEKASTSCHIRTSRPLFWLQNSPAHATQQAQAAVFDSPNRKRKRQDAGGVHVPSIKPRAGRTAKGRTPASAGFVNEEELVLVNINGKRLCPVTQHIGNDDRNEVEGVLSSPPATTPTAGSPLPTRLLPESFQSRQLESFNSSEFPDQDSCGNIGGLVGLRQGDTTFPNSIYPIDIDLQQLPTSKSTNPTRVPQMRM